MNPKIRKMYHNLSSLVSHGVASFALSFLEVTGSTV